MAIQGEVAISNSSESAPLPSPEQLKDLIVRSLDDDKAENIVVIDLAGKSTLADYMIIASGSSNRHVGAMAANVDQKVKATGLKAVDLEGTSQNDWVLIDAGDAIVHLFRPEVRSFYNIEKMWGLEAPASERSWSMTA